MKTVVCFVNFHCSESINESLETLPKTMEKISVFVVDNTSDFSFDKNYGFETKVLNPGKNLGYYNGMNHCISYLGENKIAFDWFLASNPDVIYNDVFFESLGQLDATEYQKTIIAPSILSGRTGVDLNPQIANRPSRRKMKFLARVFSSWLVGNIYISAIHFANKLFKVKNKNYQREESDIYAPHGSLAIFPPSYLQKFGLKHPCLLFGETIVVAEQAISTGFRVRYLPDLQVIHKEHATTKLVHSKKVMGYKGEAARLMYSMYWK
ncbi:MAG: hypothetical protein HEP71_28100 [Roseivirga sp.]|nr:hypothetical protein [Roseivirga sp.]